TTLYCLYFILFFFTATPTTAIYTLSLHDALPIYFGGQYTQLIARRIREQQVFSAVLPCTSSIEEIRRLEPAGIVLSGGPSSIRRSEEHTSELQSRSDLVCRLLLEKKKKKNINIYI